VLGRASAGASARCRARCVGPPPAGRMKRAVPGSGVVHRPMLMMAADHFALAPALAGRLKDALPTSSTPRVFLRPDSGLPPCPRLDLTDVAVRVHAVSLNYLDLTIRAAAAKRKHPVVQASDGRRRCHRGSAHGSPATKFGDRVAASFFPALDRWLRCRVRAHAAALVGSHDGNARRAVVLPEVAWVKLGRPAFRSGAAGCRAPVCRYHALVRAPPLLPATPCCSRHRRRSIFGLQLVQGGGLPLDASRRERGQRDRALAMAPTTSSTTMLSRSVGDAARELTAAAVSTSGSNVGAPHVRRSVAALRYAAR